MQRCYHVPRREGEPCVAGHACGSGLTCEAGSQKCRRPAREGEGCHATRPCGSGLTCEAGSQKCRKPGKVGDRCHATRPCGSGLSCQPGVHRCYHTPRQVCEPCVAGHGCAPGLSCQPGSQVCRGPQDYQIEIVWAASPSGVKQPSAKVKKRMKAAVARWRGIIAGHLPQIRYEVSAGHSYHADDDWIAAKARPGSAWNDLRIVVRINRQSAFSKSSVLAHARPVIHDGDGMPRLGMVEISEDKMDSNIGGYTEAVLVHEIGHILGFNKGMFERKNLLSGDKKKFTGSKAVAAWRAMGKTGQPPLQYDANDSGLQPGGHWDEKTLDTELMTPSTDTFIDIWSTMKLSRLSTGALQDMGYRVVECEGGEGIASGPGGATRAKGRKCADEGRRCGFSGRGRVYYGARDKWAVKEATGGIDCNNRVFGDPLRGVRKTCFVESLGGGGGGATRAKGRKCADEGRRCGFSGRGRVYYGARDKWAVKEATGGIDCNNRVFGDPLRGVRKACFVEHLGGGGGGGALAYGDFVRLKGLASRWGGHDGYLSPCGRAGACGVGVTLRPDREFTKHEPNSNLRRWQILGGRRGAPLRYGDVIRLKATASRWGGHDGFLSPCGRVGNCGVGVTLRPDREFKKHEPNSRLRDWKVLGGRRGARVQSDGVVELKALASRWGGHDGFLSPCGRKGACGVDVSLRPDREFNKHEPNSNLRKWRIEKLGGGSRP